MFENYLAKSQMGNTCFCEPALKYHEKNRCLEGKAVDGEKEGTVIMKQ